MSDDKPLVATVRPAYLEVEAGKTYVWCTCGRSRTQPFCDGAHKDTAFTPLVWTAEESRNVFFCTCKLTTTAPLCDGAHKPLAAALRQAADELVRGRKP